MEQKKQSRFTHFDQNGNAVMVDVSGKTVTNRTAVATGSIVVNRQVMEAVQKKSLKKGDVFTVAQVAGIMGAKQTASLIPMCHSLLLQKCRVEFETQEDRITVFCTVKTEGQTGAEMEALTGVQIALLTIYDMCKALDKKMCMTDIHLLKKTGGKSGDFFYEEEEV